jgi:hypothetical protein
MSDRARVRILNEEWSVYLVWGEPGHINRTLKRWGYDRTHQVPEDCWGAARGFCACEEGKDPVICLPEPPSFDRYVLATIAHEACHAVNHILRCIKTEQIDEEVFAHSVGAVVRAAAILAGREP